MAGTENAETRVIREPYKPPADRPGPHRLCFTVLVKGPVGQGDQTRARRLAEAEALTWSEELGVPKPDIEFEMFNCNWEEEGMFSFSAFYMTAVMVPERSGPGG